MWNSHTIFLTAFYCLADQSIDWEAAILLSPPFILPANEIIELVKKKIKEFRFVFHKNGLRFIW